MSSTRAKQALAQIANELREFTVEPYVVGPMGVAVLRLDVSEQISAYVGLSYFQKYQALGTYLGFAPRSLKFVVDRCLLDVGRYFDLVPRRVIANQCPAVLFPLEFFLRSPEAQPFKLASGHPGQWARRVVDDQVLRGTHAWLNGPRQLCEFLASDEAPFSWETSEVPRRVAHVVYLAHDLGEGIESARRLVAPARRALAGDADFDGCDGGQFVDLVLNHFYRSNEVLSASPH